MMTSGDPRARSAAMQARVHRLSDPLAAMGQRSPSRSLQQERRARVILLALTLGVTMTLTGLIAAVADPTAPDTESRAQRVVVVQGDSQPHVRTKSS